MPELPEVENFRKFLLETSLENTIKEVSSIDQLILANISPEELRNFLKGFKFITAQRYGKYLFCLLDNKKWLVFHFGMTGSFFYDKNMGYIPRYCRLLIEFKDSFLGFIDPRRFGRIYICSSPESFIQCKNLGPDVFDISLGEFGRRIQNKNSSIKSVLLNQSIFAGIGNIYSDEILFQSGIYPAKAVNLLSKEDIKKIWTSMTRILKIAVDREADFSAYPGDWLVNCRKINIDCPSCKEKIQRIMVNNRSSYYCPSCQKRES